MNTIFSGKTTFILKDTHGLPLYIIFDEVINKHKKMINWLEFCLEAARHGWENEKIFKEIKYSLNEARVTKQLSNGIMNKLKLYLKIDEND